MAEFSEDTGVILVHRFTKLRLPQNAVMPSQWQFGEN